MNMSARARPSRVLVADDNSGVRELLRQVLGAEGYRVDVACDGLEAIDLVQKQLPDLILLDLDMPGLDGYEVCRRLRSNPATQLVPIVIITAQSEAENKVSAWEFGADDFLTKPFHMVEVLARCRSLLRIRRLIEDLDSAEAVVFTLARAVEAKSPFTHGHSERVTRFALAMADELGVKDAARETLRRGALLHDIGKISVPDAILNKPGKLTAEEFEIVKAHTTQGAHIVEPLTTMRDLLPLIRWHHERMDGRGYPDGLAAADLPVLVRILAVVDVYDALSSERPYRGRVPHDECLAILRDSAQGGGLDPELVGVFCSIADAVAATALPGALPLPPEGLARVMPFHKDVMLTPVEESSLAAHRGGGDGHF